MNSWVVSLFSFMDGFLGYNQIQIKLEDQHKTAFIFSLCTFSSHKIPFGLKNVGDTFEWAMYYSFPNINHIFEAYLDNLVACSKRRKDHPDHFDQIFLCYRYYNIGLNMHKWNFSVELGWLPSFIILSQGNTIDPLKVEAITRFPPRMIMLLQSLQGKDNFLCGFIINYAKITKGFRHHLHY